MQRTRLSHTPEEWADLRKWWRYAFELRDHLERHPDDGEARDMLRMFGNWLPERPEWLRLLHELDVRPFKH